MKRTLLVTGLVAALVATACTPIEQTTTTSSLATTVPPTVTTLPPVQLGIGVVDDQVRVGVMVPRSGPLASFGEAILAGQLGYWDYLNDVLGGVGGQFEVAVEVFDHRYSAEEAIAALRPMSSSVIGISGALGSPIDEALAPLLDAEGMLMVSGSLSSQWVGHGAVVPNAMIPTNRDQVAASLAWLADRSPGAKPAALVQEGAYGEDCLVGYDAGVSSFGFENRARLAHSPAATDFGGVVADLAASGADTVFVCSTPDSLVRIVATADSLAFAPRWVVSSQTFDASVPAALGADRGADFGFQLLADMWVAGAAPGPGTPAHLLAADVLGTEGVDWYTFFGYAQAATFHLILEEALMRRVLTREGLRQALPALSDIDMGLDGAVSSMSGPAPVDRSAVGIVTSDSTAFPFGIPASESYYPTPFATP